MSETEPMPAEAIADLKTRYHRLAHAKTMAARSSWRRGDTGMTDADHTPDTEDYVWVRSSTLADGDRPQVHWQNGEHEGLFTLSESRDRAQALFAVAAIAEAEAAIFEGISNVPLAPSEQVPGFGLKAQAAKAANQAKMQETAARITVLLRTHRPMMSEGIEAIYGMKTKLPLVEIRWYGEPIQWDTQQVRQHALQLLEAAESAESDAFYYHFLSTLEMPEETAYGLLREFLAFRQQNRLEDLFNTVSDELEPESDR